MNSVFDTSSRLPHEQGYALVDRLLNPEFMDELEKIELVSPSLKPQAHLYPWLVPLTQLSTEQWERVMQHSDSTEGNTPRLRMFFSSSLPLDELIRRLVNAMYLQDAKGKGYIVRYYDPAVMFHYGWYLRASGVTRFLNMDSGFSISFWHKGCWHSLSASGGEAHPAGRPKPEELLFFSNCIRLLNKMTAQVADPQACIHKAANIYQALHRASHTYCLQDTADLQLFAELNEQLGKDFEQHPKVQHALEHSPDKPGYFARQLARFLENKEKDYA